TSAQGSFLDKKRIGKLHKAVAEFSGGLVDSADQPADKFLETWIAASGTATDAKEKLKDDVDTILRADSSYPEDVVDQYSLRVHEHLQKYLSGLLLRDCLRKCIRANTHDPYG